MLTARRASPHPSVFVQSGVLRLLVIAIALLGMAGCRDVAYGGRDLPNFSQVSSTLYRGGTPTRAGFARLKELGIKTVVNVRVTQPDRQLLAQLDLDYETRGMVALLPSDEIVIWFLRIAIDPARAPVLVYCGYGSERADLMVAMYRIVVENWDKERAIAEMTEGGHGFLSIWANLVTFIRKADIEAIRTAVYGGAAEPPPAGPVG